MSLGPNVKKLIAHKVSVEAIPAGGGFEAGLEFLADAARVAKTFREPAAWVAQAIQMVREAPGENPWRDKDDEAIAGELLRKVEEKLKAAKEKLMRGGRVGA
jgi:hypothetical protein